VEFNAPYKRIHKDCFFHNPTRSSVGSLGHVPEVPKDAITSPEYQVWKLRDLGPDIHPRMYEAIGSSEIFVADLTGLRPNVMIELGFALHHQNSKRLLLLFSPILGAEKVPFDTNIFRYEEIAEAQDIPQKLKRHLEAILAESKNGMI
jgi:hypothetical protein